MLGLGVLYRNLEALFHSTIIDDDNKVEDLIWREGDEFIVDEEIDSDVDEDYQFYGEKNTGPNTQKQSDYTGSSIPSEELFKKFVSRIKIEKYEGVEDELPSGAGNKIISSSKKITANRYLFNLTKCKIEYDFQHFFVIFTDTK